MPSLVSRQCGVYALCKPLLKGSAEWVNITVHALSLACGPEEPLRKTAQIDTLRKRNDQGSLSW